MTGHLTVPARRDGALRAAYVNFWTRHRGQLESAVDGPGLTVTHVHAGLAATMFSLPDPDVALVGFGAGSREAATFLADYRRSPWFRRVPLIALGESRDEGQAQFCMEWGCDDVMLRPIRRSQLLSRARIWAIRGAVRREERRAADEAMRNFRRSAEFAELIVPLGVQMMAESEFDVLLDTILASARAFSQADGGTIYLVRDDHTLEFKVLANQTLGLKFGANEKNARPLRSIPLHEDDGQPRAMAAHVAVTGETVNVEDAYTESRFDLSSMREFDAKTGYRTQSVLTIALRNNCGSVIGVLQLINAQDRSTRTTTPFDPLTTSLVESLSRLAGQALESYRRMERLRKQSEGLTIHIDEEERAKQVDAITSSGYFRELKARASALRVSTLTGETAATR